MATRLKVPTAGTTKRTRQHVLEDLSVNFVEKIVLDEGHIVEGFRKDYGYDLDFFTYDYSGGPSSGDFENDSIKIQLKATDHLTVRYKGKFVCFQAEMDHLRLWTRETMPVLLILFDAVTVQAYWLNMQPYLKSLKPTAKASRTIHIPSSNLVDAAAVRTWRQLKLDRQARIERLVPW